MFFCYRQCLLTLLRRWIRTDPDVYVNHAAIEEALGLSHVKGPDAQMPLMGYKEPLNKHSLIRLMKSLLRRHHWKTGVGFGLQATRDGVKEMIKRCAEHLDDEEVAQLMDAVNSMLGWRRSTDTFRGL
eukprot:Skav222877  [mRNA]  locus=scaffold1102:21614:23701:- [translate_table: standard]